MKFKEKHGRLEMILFIFSFYGQNIPLVVQNVLKWKWLMSSSGLKEKLMMLLMSMCFVFVPKSRLFLIHDYMCDMWIVKYLLVAPPT